MQLIEYSEIGVRAAVVHCTSRTSRLTWLLFPMVHLGPPSYYEEVERRMQPCHLVLAEGIDSRIVGALTMAYRAAGGSERLGTITQPVLHQSDDGPKVIHADVSGEQFDQAWHSLPLPIRVGVPLLAPLFGTWMRWFANPEDIHQHLETYDLPSREEVMAEAAWPALWDLVLHRRDAHLLEQVDHLHRRHRRQAWTVGVVYGAAHMGAVVHHLSERLGYVPRSADWITVFDYTH